jgi:hypothetical protein
MKCLKEQGMNHRQNAQILKRDERTVASVAYRMKGKAEGHFDDIPL